mgnify:CR=1 FL=1
MLGTQRRESSIQVTSQDTNEPTEQLKKGYLYVKGSSKKLSMDRYYVRIIGNLCLIFNYPEESTVLYRIDLGTFGFCKLVLDVAKVQGAGFYFF